MRREDDEIPRKAMEVKIYEKVIPGRPHNKWMDRLFFMKTARGKSDSCSISRLIGKKAYIDFANGKLICSF